MISMKKLIVYKQDNGRVAIIIPSDDYVEKHGINAVAKKDVPAGKPYAFINQSEVPLNSEMRDAWTVDDADLKDGIGGA